MTAVAGVAESEAASQARPKPKPVGPASSMNYTVLILRCLPDAPRGAEHESAGKGGRR